MSQTGLLSNTLKHTMLLDFHGVYSVEPNLVKVDQQQVLSKEGNELIKSSKITLIIPSAFHQYHVWLKVCSGTNVGCI